MPIQSKSPGNYPMGSYSMQNASYVNTYSQPQQQPLPPLHFYSTKNYVVDNTTGSNPPINTQSHPHVHHQPYPVLHYPSVSPVQTSSMPQYNYYSGPVKAQSSDSEHEGSGTGTDKFAIDYSSIINYTNSPSLKRKRRQHTYEQEGSTLPKLPCSVCGKVFNKPYNLKSHMRSHSTDKPYGCTVCGKKFARSHDKKRHELLHKGEKSFKCDGFLKDGKTRWGCGKKFARSDALSRHFRTETGWLCIKPLMDEAKHLESKDLINNLTRG
ncbi:DNA-binding transcription factor [Yamadazyma tenuis]|nr:DNA-binding transcription factor [Yamadazyma tenuis]